MEWRPLGDTGLRVTPVGLGLAALGRPAYINAGRDQDLGPNRTVAVMERRCHEVLDAAYASGVRYLDVARSYGLAEAFLRSWLDTRGVPVDAVTVGSKWGYSYKGDWRMDAPAQETKDLSLDTLRRQLGESREQLGDRLRLYQIHSATLESGVLDDQRVLAELFRLHSEGLVIGLSTTGPRQADVIRRALAVEVNGENPFRVVQATWNLLEPSCGEALAEAHAAGWGVIVKEALANGRLARVDQIAIAAALRNPWVDVVLSGAVTIEQLRSNVQGAEIPLSAAQVQTFDAMTQTPQAYWAERALRPWT